MKIILGKPIELEDTETSDISPIVRELLCEQCREPEFILDLVEVCDEECLIEYKTRLV